MRNRMVIALTAVCCALASFAPTASLAGPAEDEAAINAVWAEYSKARVEGDAAKWLALWDDGGIQMPPGAPARGKTTLDEVVPKAFAAVPATSMTISPEEIQLMGDWAFSRGIYQANQMVQGNAVAVDGKFLTIFRRQDDGSWKIYRDIFNSNSQ